MMGSLMAAKLAVAAQGIVAAANRIAAATTVIARVSCDSLYNSAFIPSVNFQGVGGRRMS